MNHGSRMLAAAKGSRGNFGLKMDEEAGLWGFSPGEDLRRGGGDMEGGGGENTICRHYLLVLGPSDISKPVI